MKIPGARTFMSKHSVVIGGHKTSVSLEPIFWAGFKDIAKREKLTLSDLACLIDASRGAGQNLSSTIRVYILEDTRNLARASTERSNTLEKMIEAMRDAGENVCDGMAPISTVIAGGRANA